MKKQKSQSIRSAFIVDHIQFFILLAPAIIMVFLYGYTTIYGIQVAFKDFNPNLGIWGSKWVGLDNFKFFFASNDAWRVIRNTLLYEGWFLLQGPIVASTVALMCYNLSKNYLVKGYLTVMNLPRFMSMILISFIIFALLNPRSGVVNQILANFGVEAVDWYAKPNAWIIILPLTRMWQSAGSSCLLYYATLVGINPELFEAAKMDGASKWQQTWHIALPELKAIIAIQTILGVASIFSGDFGLHYQATRNVGVLYPTTDIINTYTFRTMMSGAFSKSAAVGLMQSIVGIILTFSVNGIVRKINPDYTMF